MRASSFKPALAKVVRMATNNSDGSVPPIVSPSGSSTSDAPLSQATPSAKKPAAKKSPAAKPSTKSAASKTAASASPAAKGKAKASQSSAAKAPTAKTSTTKAAATQAAAKTSAAKTAAAKAATNDTTTAASAPTAAASVPPVPPAPSAAAAETAPAAPAAPSAAPAAPSAAPAAATSDPYASTNGTPIPGYAGGGATPGNAAYTPVPAGPPKGLSIASMATGIASVLLTFMALGLLPGIAAVVMGHMAQKKQPYARPLWLTGLITGYVATGLGLLTILAWILFFVLLLSGELGGPSDYYYY